MTRRTALSIALSMQLGALAIPAQAANWLMLQGTEPAGSAGRAKLWGFVQAQYQKDFSDPFTAPGKEIYVPPKLIGPNLEEQAQFNINRARIGVRGANFPLDTKTNYFVLLEMGNNGITHGSGSFAHLTDASVTLNHIPGARIRLGMFKYPGSEEGLQAIHVFDWINFTTVTNQLLLERFPTKEDVKNASDPKQRDLNAIDGTLNENLISNPVGAFRDIGVQVFDTFRRADWEHSYAVMYGNGHGLNLGNGDGKGNLYLYWSSEKVFGGKGGRREGWKSFVWWQQGDRKLYSYDTGTDTFSTETVTRTRWGLGTKYLKKPFRVTAEYMRGKGAIFYGPHNPDRLLNDRKASGWYLEGGWYIPGTKWEIDARYDRYTRDENDAGADTRFRTFTIGAQYHFNKKTRINMEYAFRNFESDVVNVDRQLEDVGGRFAIQVTAIF